MLMRGRAMYITSFLFFSITGATLNFDRGPSTRDKAYASKRGYYMSLEKGDF